MIWQDLLLDQWVDAEALRAAMAVAFGVPSSSVAVVDDVAELVNVPGSVRIILERTREYREFPLQLLIVLRDAAIEARSTGFDDVLSIVQRVATALGATVVFGDGPVEPYESVRVRPNGALDIVSLDTDDGEEVDSYFVVSARPYDESRRPERATGQRAG